MSENQDRRILDLSKYDTMATEELEEILRLDSEAPEGQESDTEVLLYVMEVLANRRNTNNTGKTAQQAWESFQQQYLPEEEESLEYTLENKKSAKRTQPWLRRLIAAAAVIGLLVSIPLTAGAFGWEDIWNAIAKWAKETFSFVVGEDIHDDAPSSENTKQYESLQQALEATNRESDFIPTKIPEGYQLKDIVMEESPERKTHIAIYKNGEMTMQIFVQSYLLSDPENIEVNEDLLEVYEASGVEYYIVANNEQLRAVWIKDSYECYISGDLTIEEIKMMIDSIGKG